MKQLAKTVAIVLIGLRKLPLLFDVAFDLVLKNFINVIINPAALSNNKHEKTAVGLIQDGEKQTTNLIQSFA